MGSTIVFTQTISNTVNWITLNSFTGLIPNTKYILYVAIDSYGAGPFNYGCTIQTPSALKTESNFDEEFNAMSYPNPFSDYFMIDIKSNSQSLINIKTYDMLGRLIEQRDSKVDEIRNTQLGDRYPSGIYNVVITQDEEIKTMRMIKR